MERKMLITIREVMWGKTNFGRGTYTTTDLIFIIIRKYSSDLLS
jgi:hypothetical protein